MIVLFLWALVGAAASSNCPSGYEEHPLVLISLDGFRGEYLRRNLTPNIQALKDKGASPPYMRASIPTLTFPNHYTIATGLNAESHGIVGNNFFDPVFNATFNSGNTESLEERWWGGEPIWNTVVKQGKKSGIVYWPGSDAAIEGMHPTYYYRYDNDNLLSFPERVDQVLSWLSLPPSTRPLFIAAYFSEPDHSGHTYGPNSIEVNDTLVAVDALIGSLVEGIENLSLTDCVNIIIIADHGMTETGEQGNVELTDYVPDLDHLALTLEGPFNEVYLYDQYKRERDNIRQNLTCQRPELRQFIAPGLPKRNHFSNNRRIGDIIIPMALGYEGRVDSYWALMGDHGYDNYYEDMAPIFVAAGPEFRQSEVEPFHNIEIYNLMCELVGVNPAPNNGTQSGLYHLLNSHPHYPLLLKELTPLSPPFPDNDELPDREKISGCPGDDSCPLNLNFTSEETDNLVEKHLPWGIPQSGDLPASLLLLVQEDHVTGYSQTLKMPLWTSFTVANVGNEHPQAKWSSDVRLTSQNTATCSSYDHLASSNITMQPLFPNCYGENSDSSMVDFIVSNAVPISDDVLLQWRHLTEVRLRQWVSTGSSPINVVTGPLFDKNADSLVDDFTKFKSSPTVPSDLFMVATRCLVPSSDLYSTCAPEDLDAIAFIYPEIQDIPNCLSNDEFALGFSAKVHDVELATGLTFFPNLPSEDRVRLSIRIHTSLWPIDLS